MDTQQETQNFSKDGLKVQVTFKPHCRYVIEVVIEPAQVQKMHKDAVKKISKQVSLPGFRKGKAPEEVIISNYASFIEEEFKEMIAQYGITKSLELAELKPVSNRSIEKYKLKTYSTQEGAELEYECETMPMLPSIDEEDMVFEGDALQEVTSEDIDKSIEDLRTKEGTSIAITDRGVQEGDFVHLDIENLEEKETSYICQDERFQVTAGEMSPWLKAHLLGKKVGDTFDATSELDPAASDEVKQLFRATLCRVTIKQAYIIEPAEVNAEFLKKYAAEDIEQLRKKLETNLQQQRQMERTQKNQQNMQKYLADRYTVDMPMSLVLPRQQQLLRQELQMLKQKNLPAQEFAEQKKELEQNTLQRATKELLVDLLLQKLAQDKNIVVSKQEINTRWEREIMQIQFFDRKTYDQLTQQDFVQIYNMAKNTLLRQKAMDYLLKKANLQ